jgi:hypothetical protein
MVVAAWLDAWQGSNCLGGDTNMAFWIGALIPTGAFTFLFFWLSKKVIALKVVGWLMANALSLVTCTALGAFGLADGGHPRVVESFAGYVVPQLIWLVVTGVILRGQIRKQAAG